MPNNLINDPQDLYLADIIRIKREVHPIQLDQSNSFDLAGCSIVGFIALLGFLFIAAAACLGFLAALHLINYFNLVP